MVSAVLANLSRELDNAGHQVTVLAELAGAPFDGPGDLVPLGVRPDRWAAGMRLRVGAAANAATGWFGPGYPWRLASLRHQARRAPHPDAVVVHDDPRAIRHLHRWLPGVPVVAFQHSVPYRRPPERAPADRPDAVVTVTSALARHAPRIARRARGDDLLLARALRSPLCSRSGRARSPRVDAIYLGLAPRYRPFLLTLSAAQRAFTASRASLLSHEPLVECSWPVPGPPGALWQPLRGPSRDWRSAR